MPQVSPRQGKSPSRTFEAALLIARDAVAGQSLLATNARRFFDALLQKSTRDFFMHFKGHFRAQELVFRTNISEHSCVIETTARVHHVHISLVIAEVLDRAGSLPEFGVNDSSELAIALVQLVMVGILVARAPLPASPVLFNELVPYYPF